MYNFNPFDVRLVLFFTGNTIRIYFYCERVVRALIDLDEVVLQHLNIYIPVYFQPDSVAPIDSTCCVDIIENRIETRIEMELILISMFDADGLIQPTNYLWSVAVQVSRGNGDIIRGTCCRFSLFPSKTINFLVRQTRDPMLRWPISSTGFS